MSVTAIDHLPDTEFPDTVPDGYTSLEEWGADSDYRYGITADFGLGWYDDSNNLVDLQAAYDAAMEAAAEWDASMSPDGQPRFLTGFGTFTELESSIKALLFGELVKRARGVIELYESDLFHDATRIDKIEGPCRFWWGPRQCGADMGPSPWWKGTSIMSHLAGDPTFVGYWVDLTCKSHDDAQPEKGGWYVTFTRFDPKDHA